ncbi:MAG: hypothetical protein COB17_07930 [Sulfurimonas sp.]|nr:MAG: hypothetical protein COB17_07930 [Sulfurimonas sp.]
MNNEQVNPTLLKIFNRNIPIKDIYTADEIRVAFIEESYSSGNDREKFLYIRFFKECANNEDLEELCKLYNTTTTRIKRLYKSFSDEYKIEFGTFWSSRFRLPKIIGKIFPRKHKKYTEIDSFEAYELTPCLAYEMATRNQKVKELLKRYNKISIMLGKDEYMLNIHMSKNIYKFIYGIEDGTELENQYLKYEALYEEKQLNYRKLIKQDYKIFIDNYIDMCTELHISTLSELKNKIEDELINYYLIYPTGYQRDVPGVNFLYQEEILNSKNKKNKKIIDQNTDNRIWQIRFEEIINDEFIQVQGVHINSDDFFVNNIIPNFKRQVNDQHQIKIPINFSLPLEEILEYITKVKEKINPKTPLEFLGSKLKKADNLTNINTITDKNEESSLDITRGEAPQQKLADLLYIYDMKLKGFSNAQISYAIYEYKSKLLGFEPDERRSNSTIKKYFEIAEDYIENERYQELITGKTVKK